MYGGNDIIVNLEEPREKKFDSMMGNLINYTPQFTGEIELIDLENDDIEKWNLIDSNNTCRKHCKNVGGTIYSKFDFNNACDIIISKGTQLKLCQFIQDIIIFKDDNKSTAQKKLSDHKKSIQKKLDEIKASAQKKLGDYKEENPLDMNFNYCMIEGTKITCYYSDLVVENNVYKPKNEGEYFGLLTLLGQKLKKTFGITKPVKIYENEKRIELTCDDKTKEFDLNLFKGAMLCRNYCDIQFKLSLKPLSSTEFEKSYEFYLNAKQIAVSTAIKNIIEFLEKNKIIIDIKYTNNLDSIIENDIDVLNLPKDKPILIGLINKLEIVKKTLAEYIANKDVFIKTAMDKQRKIEEQKLVSLNKSFNESKTNVCSSQEGGALPSKDEKMYNSLYDSIIEPTEHDEKFFIGYSTISSFIQNLGTINLIKTVDLKLPYKFENDNLENWKIIDADHTCFDKLELPLSRVNKNNKLEYTSVELYKKALKKGCSFTIQKKIDDVVRERICHYDENKNIFNCFDMCLLPSNSRISSCKGY